MPTAEEGFLDVVIQFAIRHARQWVQSGTDLRGKRRGGREIVKDEFDRFT